MNKKLNTYFDKARKIQGKPLIDQAEIRNRLGNKSIFADKIIFPKIKGVTKMTIIGSSLTVFVVAFFLLFNPLHNEKNLANSDKKIITKEHTYDVDEKLSKEQSERTVLLDDTDDINKDQIPILRLTEEELKKLDIYLSDEGIKFTVESKFEEHKYSDFDVKDLKDKGYPESMENPIIKIKRYTKDYQIEWELLPYNGWDLNRSTRYMPIGQDYLWRSYDGKFGSFRKDFQQNPLIEPQSWRFVLTSIRNITKVYSSNILDIGTSKIEGFDIAKSEYFDVSYINDQYNTIINSFIPVYIFNKIKTGNEHHILWFAPTEELIERLPERYQDMILNRYDLIEDNYIVPDDVKLAFEKKWKKDKEQKDDELDFVPKRIAGIEKLELTWDELKKIGIRIEDGKLVSNGQEWYFTKNKERGYLKILREKKYPTNIDSGIFRIKSMIDTISFELSHEKPLKYENWDMKNGAEIFPVAITILHNNMGYTDENGQVSKFVRSTEYVEDKNPLLDKYADTDDLLYNGNHGFQSKLKLLIPVNIKFGEHIVKDSSKYKNATINYWFFATEEFVELLPDRYRIPIMKELKMISNVEEGSMSYEDACSALKGESYFGLCTMESENIKNLKIYPNPSFDGEFNLKFDLLKTCKLSFDVYSTDGEKIANIDGMLHHEMNDLVLVLELGDSISNGVYLLSISTDIGDMITTKIIIER